MNKKMIKNLQDSLNVLREQLARLNKMITDTQSEMHNISKQVGDLQQYTEDLDTRKADVIYVDAQLLKVSDRFIENGRCIYNNHTLLVQILLFTVKRLTFGFY
ncbi:hypothetical protein EG68_02807 [Paragonimus skrjabini miyazakii]|uniref:Uncharacterized protein n=1 Tax=Paragonimus skrjabini miyazakii TaxID=59628 RepID=A0A8S9YFS2_9TREM|nr:hypothetical protein EG68_02807 [Paragonimus skrjabini miyazakii]